MGRLLILNGSPRAPRSNSRQYALLVSRAWPMEQEYREITRKNHLVLCQMLEEVSDVLLVFPLYADGLPVSLLEFLKTLDAHPPRQRPRISVLINCGFFEPSQNDVAVDMVRYFAMTRGYPFGSVLQIGSGEAILASPFAFLVRARIRKLVRVMAEGKRRTWKVTMPLPRWLFLRASRTYWTRYGQRHGVSPAQMATPEVEGD